VGTDEHRQRAREAGFDHHLVKPVYLELLQETLGKIEKTVEATRPDPTISTVQ
jgi:hypothetical protein